MEHWKKWIKKVINPFFAHARILNPPESTRKTLRAQGARNKP